MDDERVVTIWSANGLTVTARRGLGDSLVLVGQDLNPDPEMLLGLREYEYGLTVAAADVPAVVAALGGPPGADVLDLLVSRGETVVGAGETHWLAAIGVEAEFWSRSE